MLAAADLAVSRGLLSDDDRQALSALISQLGPLPSITDLPADELIAAVRRDKKVVHGTLHFVLATSIGATITVDDVTEEELRGVLRRLGVVG
jgi:3-dehydroquinate synthetase